VYVPVTWRGEGGSRLFDFQITVNYPGLTSIGGKTLCGCMRLVRDLHGGERGLLVSQTTTRSLSTRVTKVTLLADISNARKLVLCAFYRDVRSEQFEALVGLRLMKECSDVLVSYFRGMQVDVSPPRVY